MKSNLSAAGHALKLGFFVSGLTVASLAARFATADTTPEARERTELAAMADHRLSDASLRKLFDSENNPIYGRFDPALKHAPDYSAIHVFEGPAPNLHMYDLPPASAQAVNASVPFSLDPNPAARAFVATGSAEDKANALTCMTQAVYYEAGFEPEAGQQAVAQVVLNRMRHPIFPHSVCGVVYQGAELKTGCQFSFTCDGSLNKKPAQGAWDRSRLVAERALNGFVMKGVGEATHYHTSYVVPWWQPTVTKIAQVGAHIFYRWPGTLGQPGAFTMRYAGNERIQATPTSPALADAGTLTLPKDANGRVHAVLTTAAAVIQPSAPVEVAKAPEQLALAQVDLQAAPVVKVEAPRAQPAMQVRTANNNCFTATCSHW